MHVDFVSPPLSMSCWHSMPVQVGVNVTASNHEWQAMLNEEMPAVQYDIKQIYRVCPPQCREAISVFL
jgi:hypothetical protein